LTYSVVAKKLKKQFKRPTPQEILKEVDFEVEEGTSVAITGRSGEGKSTLLHILGTLDNPTSGTIELCGQEVTFHNIQALRLKHIGFLYQSFHLLEDFTVLDNVLMPAKIARQAVGPKSPAYERALGLLGKVGLSAHQDKLAKQLSGGEKQRVALARALINDPDILFADEPTGNLDLTTSEEIHNLLLSLTKEEGKTLVVVTHDQGLASLLDQNYELRSGVLTKAPSSR